MTFFSAENRHNRTKTTTGNPASRRDKQPPGNPPRFSGPKKDFQRLWCRYSRGGSRTAPTNGQSRWITPSMCRGRPTCLPPCLSYTFSLKKTRVHHDELRLRSPERTTCDAGPGSSFGGTGIQTRKPAIPRAYPNGPAGSKSSRRPPLGAQLKKIESMKNVGGDEHRESHHHRSPHNGIKFISPQPLGYIR